MKRRMIKCLKIATIIISITLISCNENEISICNTCNVESPAEELDWLKEAIDRVSQDESSYYCQANYKEETVFYYLNCDPTINYVSLTYNCSGEILGYTNGLLDELTEITILWKHEESVCNFIE